MKVNLGDQVQDRVTGFKGIVTARSEYLNGCTRVGVHARAKGNAQSEPSWIDEPQLRVVRRGVLKVGPQITGGPRPDSVRLNPTR